MSYHAWKRRLWGPEYPIYHGPPYVDPATGAPMLPGGIVGGPYQGVNDNGPQTGNPVVLTFTGPATGDLDIGVLIFDETASAPAGGRWVGASVSVESGATADQIGQAIADNFNARNWDGWVSAVNAAGTVTFTPQAAGSATGTVIYGPYSGSDVAGGGNTLPDEDFVEGPFQSPNGQPWWHQRKDGNWFYWTDIDADPEPDVRLPMDTFLADTNIDEAYRADVRARAEAAGYPN